jgi:hypothetical protein
MSDSLLIQTSAHVALQFAHIFAHILANVVFLHLFPHVFVCVAYIFANVFACIAGISYMQIYCINDICSCTYYSYISGCIAYASANILQILPFRTVRLKRTWRYSRTPQRAWTCCEACSGQTSPSGSTDTLLGNSFAADGVATRLVKVKAHAGDHRL